MPGPAAGRTLRRFWVEQEHASPPPRRHPFFSPLRLRGAHDAPRLSLLRAKASSDDSSAASGDELVDDLKAKWDAVENKSTVLTYAGGAIVAVWFSSVIVGAINSLPLLPKIMELVGLGYTGWFVYRYLLFKVRDQLRARLVGTSIWW